MANTDKLTMVTLSHGWIPGRRWIIYHHFQAMLTKVLAVIQQSIEIITFPIHETFNQGSGTRRRCRIIRYAQNSLRMTLVLVHIGTRHSSLQPINNIIINRKCPRKILVTIKQTPVTEVTRNEYVEKIDTTKPEDYKTAMGVVVKAKVPGTNKVLTLTEGKDYTVAYSFIDSNKKVKAAVTIKSNSNFATAEN